MACEICVPDCEGEDCPMNPPDYTPRDYGPATDIRSAENMSAREGYHL